MEMMDRVHRSMINLSDANYAQQKLRYSLEFEKLDQLINTVKIAVEACDDHKARQREKAALKKLERLRQRFETYCRQLTILTFNGAKYDLNLVRQYLMPQMTRAVRASKESATKTKVNGTDGLGL